MRALYYIIFLVPLICLSQADILNTKSAFDIQPVSKLNDYYSKPLEYEYVDDDDILFSFTTWEVIDLNQKINFPLYYPIDNFQVTIDRKPLIDYLFEAIEKAEIGATAYADINFRIPLDEDDIYNIKNYKKLKPRTDNDNLEGLNWFDEKGSWKKHLEDLGYQFPDEDWVDFDPMSENYYDLQGKAENDENIQQLVKEYYARWEKAAAEIMPDSDFNSAEFQAEDVRKYLLKGIWYFSKKSTHLSYRPIAIGPVAKNALKRYEAGESDSTSEGDSEVEVDEATQNAEYEPLFWIFYPELRDILSKSYAFNDKNMSKPISFDHIINSRRFSGTIYKEANVYQDRDIRKYIGNNSLMQLLESERIKEKIRNMEQDMWSY